MKSGLSQNPDLQGVQIWQMGEQFGRDVAELRALQRPICINQKKIFRFFPCNKADGNLNKLFHVWPTNSQLELLPRKVSVKCSKR